MTAAEFHSLLASPETLTSFGLDELKQLHNKYPFSSLLAALVAKKAHLVNAENKVSLITKAAMQVPSRAYLKQFVEEPTSAPVPVEIASSQIQDEWDAESEPNIEAVLPLEENVVNPIAEETIEFDEVDQQIQAANYTAELEEEIRALEAFDVEEQISKAGMARPIQEQEIKSEEITLDNSSQTFMDWIDNLTEESEVISPIAEDISSKGDAEFNVSHVAAKAGQSSIISNDLYTETLACIYEEQSKWKRAIEVYQGLSLKHPEKSGYFAARIAALQDKII